VENDETSKFDPSDSDAAERLAEKLYESSQFRNTPWARLDDTTRGQFRQDAETILAASQRLRESRAAKPGINETIPWKNIRPEHRETQHYLAVLDHAEYMDTGGEGIPDRRLKDLREWYEWLTETGFTLDYDPSKGWTYVPREPADGHLLVHVTDHTALTPAAKEVWRLPNSELWPDVQ